MTPLRLTLRTLLAYLDDTLEPAQARLIGQKVAESDTAQELITRIKQVTHRRRLTTPPETGPGARLDPNTIAEYLDNTLDPDQLAEVEQTCLASDVHLAEVATCHQILTLVLGEPALVPPTAKQRMYGLVKGREAIPFRKPPAPSQADADEPREGREVDETLRLGLPALRRQGGWSNWLVIGGGAAALVACLIVAFVVVLTSGGDLDEPEGPGRHLQAKANGKKANPAQPGKGKDGAADAVPKKDRETPADGSKQQGKTDDDKKGATKTDRTDEKDKKVPVVNPSGEVALEPPSKVRKEIGRYDPPAPPAATILLQQGAKGGEWVRLERQAKPTRVWTATPLVSLPGFRSTVTTDSQVRLVLAGTIPEFLPGPLPLYEARVVLHAHDQLDLDLTLERGRILLISQRGDRPARVRVRFENTTDPKSIEIWDIILEQKDSEVLVERAGGYSPEEPFHPNPKDPARLGPVSNVGLIVVSGSATVRPGGNDTYTLNAPPGPSLIHWNSLEGPKGPFALKKVPEFVSARPPIPKDVPENIRADLEKGRADMERAARQLSVDLSARAVELGLLKAMDSNEVPVRRLSVRAYGALDMLPQLVNALADKRQDVRQTAIDTLRHWCGSSRNNDYLLVEQLQKQDYPKVQADSIVALLHSFSAAARARPETYDVLIAQLTAPQLPLPIRELAAYHLSRMVPQAARDINAAPEAPPDVLRQIQARLRALIPPGQVPPGAPKDKGAGPGE